MSAIEGLRRQPCVYCISNERSAAARVQRGEAVVAIRLQARASASNRDSACANTSSKVRRSSSSVKIFKHRSPREVKWLIGLGKSMGGGEQCGKYYVR